ncbi:hypothetical protein WISP_52996 [Willisornis vidua]|uniref:Endonuclease/exonuclease/phosphatase domain-containing protein n=1 Tax=Willisornis vidua TaxID=1566151 RepID=A0ABQ9DEE6_9PASS|nr:hypothetical protein WISP_52996 [Willisornis vidua]
MGGTCVQCEQVSDLLCPVAELKEEVEKLRCFRESEKEIDWWSQILLNLKGVQQDDGDELFYKQLADASKSPSLVLLGDFNLPDTYWELHTAEKRQSRNFLECIEDNFLHQLEMSLPGDLNTWFSVQSYPEQQPYLKIVQKKGKPELNLKVTESSISQDEVDWTLGSAWGRKKNPPA